LVGLKKSKRVSKQLVKRGNKTAKIKVDKSSAVITNTGFGDGLYPVYAKITDEGKWGKRVGEIRVKFI
jgi:hypothetical protein